jgi:hypothetical protein
LTFRLYLDEDSTHRALIRALQARGLDIENAVDAGMTARTDLEQLEHAAAAGRVLYSYNVGDFAHLHRLWLDAGKSHAGLVLVPQQRYSIGEQMRRVLRLAGERGEEEMRDRIELLSAWG